MMIKLINILIIVSFMSHLVANDFEWGWSEPNLLFNGTYEIEIIKDVKNNLYNKLIWHYRKSDSHWRGANCPCFPSCSAFTLYSMNKYGFINGFFIGLDRIFFRENYGLINELNYYSIERTSFIDQDLKSGIYDPPEANNIFKRKDWRSVNPYFYFIYERDSSSTN